MAKKLNKTESTWSRAVLHDIFEAGGLIKHGIRTRNSNNLEVYAYQDVAKVICEEIKYRNFDFPKVDTALNAISSVPFSDLHEYSRKHLEVKQLAHIIAAFCAEHQIFWDDVNTLRTTTEMEVYRKTALGEACWDFKCFLSQQSSKKKTATRTVDPATGKTIPKSGYKSSGPKSGLVKGLIGKPGEKITLPSSNVVFVIVCTSTKPKKQYVYVSPLASEKVKLGDPSGYSDCKLFYDSIDTARDVIAKIESGSVSIPEYITGFELSKQKVDPNGYFQIKTDLGPAYIKASKLNEALEEDVDELEEKPLKRRAKYPEIIDIDVYHEAMQRYE